MIRIRLPRGEWDYDPESPLGPAGGFGAVFAGRGEKYGPVAIKRLHLSVTDAAHRELRIADELVQRPLEHVVPILDAGKDAESGSYFVVMPQAEKSLQQEIDHIGVFTDKEAVEILRDIATGLAEVPEIVHRDMKPANVLYHEGRWKVADFGIARFVEESTSLQTLKDCLSPPYAAPEQWRMERATPATDIYALGCIAYALLTGAPPFQGPSIADFRDRHLHADPPPLTESRPRLRALVAMMLRKTPEGRPSLDRVIQILDDISMKSTTESSGAGLSALAQAGASAAEAAIRADATQMQYEARQRARKNLADGAFQVLREVIETLFARILDAAPTAKRSGSWDRHLQIQLGAALLEVELLNRGLPIPESAFQESGWDVVAGATICVDQSEPTRYKWGANLWYTNLGRGNEYRWWEVLYYNVSTKRAQYYANYEPFALDVASNDFTDADLAASHVMHVINMAAEPRPIDDESIDNFCNRWADLLAKAYHGQLSRPQRLPLA